MVLPRFVLQALRGDPLTVFGTGEQMRCFCHVLDVVPALIRLVAADSACGRAVNFGSTSRCRSTSWPTGSSRPPGPRARSRALSYQEAYGSGYEDMQRRRPGLRARLGPDRLPRPAQPGRHHRGRHQRSGRLDPCGGGRRELRPGGPMRAKTAGPSQRDAAGTSPTRRQPRGTSALPAVTVARASAPTRHPFAGAVWLAVVLAGALIAGLVVGVQRLSAPAPPAEGRGGLDPVLEHRARHRGRAGQPAGRQRGLAVDLRPEARGAIVPQYPPGSGGRDRPPTSARLRAAAHADRAEPRQHHRRRVVLPAGGPDAARPGADGPADRPRSRPGRHARLRRHRHRLRGAARRRPARRSPVRHRARRRRCTPRASCSRSRVFAEDQRRGQADQRNVAQDYAAIGAGRRPGAADGLRLPLGDLRARPDRPDRLGARRAALRHDADPAPARSCSASRCSATTGPADTGPAVSWLQALRLSRRVPRCRRSYDTLSQSPWFSYTDPAGRDAHGVVRERGQLPRPKFAVGPGRRDRRRLPVDVRLRGPRHLGGAAAGAAHVRAGRPPHVPGGCSYCRDCRGGRSPILGCLVGALSRSVDGARRSGWSAARRVGTRRRSGAPAAAPPAGERCPRSPRRRGADAGPQRGRWSSGRAWARSCALVPRPTTCTWCRTAPPTRTVEIARRAGAHVHRDRRRTSARPGRCRRPSSGSA